MSLTLLAWGVPVGLLLVFGSAKLADREAFRGVLLVLGGPAKRFSHVGSIGVPLVEMVVAMAALVVPGWSTEGAIVALFVLLAVLGCVLLRKSPMPAGPAPRGMKKPAGWRTSGALAVGEAEVEFPLVLRARVQVSDFGSFGF